MCIEQYSCNFSICTTSLKTGVPALTTYEALRSQFNWLVDGEVSHLIEQNLVPELENMEMYLREEGRADVIRELDDSAVEGETYYSESGELYKLVGVLRAADMFWNPAGKPVLLHKYGDPMLGDSPRILFRPFKG